MVRYGDPCLMGKEFTPQEVETVQVPTTVDTLNKMFTDIETALDDVISRSGAAPNVFTSDYGMNSNIFENLLSNRGTEPDIYTEALSLLVSILSFERTQGQVDVDIDLTPATVVPPFQAAQAVRTSAINISTTLILTWQLELYDDGDWITVPSNRMTVPAGQGITKVMCSFGWNARPSASAAYPAGMHIEVLHFDSNDVPKSIGKLPKQDYTWPAIATPIAFLPVRIQSAPLDVADGDYFQVQVTNHEATDLSVQFAGTSMGFIVERV